MPSLEVLVEDVERKGSAFLDALDELAKRDEDTTRQLALVMVGVLADAMGAALNVESASG